MRQATRSAWLPSQSHEHLIRAALADGDQAVGGWRAWRAQASPEEITQAGLQLMPLVWRNLSRIDPTLDGLDRMKGTYRFVWVKNQTLLRFGTEVLPRLHREGIETLLLKGVALSLQYYRDLGTRLMADLDVLVPRAQGPNAIDVLSSFLQPDPYPRPRDRLGVHHSASFVSSPGKELDLHWYSMWLSSSDEDFWLASVPIDVDGVESRTLCTADHLLQVCAHGAGWDVPLDLRWITDAMVLIRSEGEFDWHRLITQARRCELTVTMTEALDYLRSAFDAPVPDQVLHELRATRPPLRERIGRYAATRERMTFESSASPASETEQGDPTAGTTASRPTLAIRTIALHWTRYRRLRRLESDEGEGNFAAHLKRLWGQATYRDFLARALSRAFRGRRSGSRPAT